MVAVTQIGKLTQRVRFDQQGTTADGTYGPQPGSWTEVATVMAEVQEVLPSRAENASGGIRMEMRPARIRCRYRSDITSAMRVVLLDRGNRVLRIVSGPAEIGGRRRFIELMAEEYSTAGDGA